MGLRRRITTDGRINIGDDARGETLTGKVTISGSVKGILIAPYVLGDEGHPECKVTTWDSGRRIFLPVQFREKVNLKPGDMVDLVFRDNDGAVLLVPANDTCALCGQPSKDMVTMENGRKVCRDCIKKLCTGNKP